MKTKALLILCVIYLNACTAVQSPYTYRVIYPQTTHVKFEFLVANEENEKTIIQGALFHRPMSSPTIETGHIDIAVYAPEGNLLLEKIAHYKSPMNGRYEWTKTGVRFWIPLDSKLPAGSIIKLAFHVEHRFEKETVNHGANIAL